MNVRENLVINSVITYKIHDSEAFSSSLILDSTSPLHYTFVAWCSVKSTGTTLPLPIMQW